MSMIVDGLWVAVWVVVLACVVAFLASYAWPFTTEQEENDDV